MFSHILLDIKVEGKQLSVCKFLGNQVLLSCFFKESPGGYFIQLRDNWEYLSKRSEDEHLKYMDVLAKTKTKVGM